MATCVGIVNNSKLELVKEPCEVFGFKSEEKIIFVAEVACIASNSVKFHVCKRLEDTFRDKISLDDSPPSDCTVESVNLDVES